METHILVVDDDPSIRSFLKTALERTPGQHVEVASDAATALTMVRHGQYGVVLVDLRLPGQGGAELLRTLKQERPDLPVIAITGAATTEEALQAIRLGAVDVILKPISLPQLNEAMQKGLARRQAPAAVVDTALPLLAMREKAVRQLERDYLIRVLTEERGHLGATARRAGVNAKTLYEKMRAYGLRKEDFRRRGGFARAATAASSSSSPSPAPSNA
ncbi:MAG TPA: response regulator [Thermodesulfobacteriota bacterium]